MDTSLKSHIPKNVLESLSPDELQEVDELVAKITDERLISELIGVLDSTNRGIWYLSMSESIKYSLIQTSQVSNDDLVQLIEFDATGFDSFRKAVFQNKHRKQALWEQRFDLTLAALGNPNIQEETAYQLLNKLVEINSDNLSPQEIVLAIGYQLFDKWTPKEFSKQALCALVKFFDFHGVPEYLPQLKRLERHAK